MIPLDSPLIAIRVNKPLVDEITVHSEYGDSWKINGSKDGQTVWSLDQLQDRFDCVIQVLAEYVDETSEWLQSEKAQPISAWHAMMLLTQRGDIDD